MPRHDVAIIGGGIVGLAAARAVLLTQPGTSLVLLEKEPQLGAHQTSHNSGVIHSGVYYQPGSLKAKTCVAGAALMREFCRAHRIPVRECGKVIVATQPSERPALERLHQRGLANGVRELTLLGPDALRELEPHASGAAALHVPSAAVVDYQQVAEAIAGEVRQLGGEIRRASGVLGIRRERGVWTLATPTGDAQARRLVTCAGLHADRIARMAGGDVRVRIIPFRGEYHELVPARRNLVRGMVYPVPNPAFPFLGVHFTPTPDGGVHVGPNAVLAGRREGYRRGDRSMTELCETLAFPGLWGLALRHGRSGLREWWRARHRGSFVEDARRLVPSLEPNDLAPSGSGVRAQAVDRLGRLLSDFSIVRQEGAVHVLNVPSPAATASLEIGRLIAEMTLDAPGRLR